MREAGREKKERRERGIKSALILPTPLVWHSYIGSRLAGCIAELSRRTEDVAKTERVMWWPS